VWINPRDYKVIGRWLEAARKSAGLTQTELAKRLGKPQSFVSACESGQRRIDLLELGKIAQALGRGTHALIDELLDRIVPATPSGKSTEKRKHR
jgi:transcriptional regulator with XRE-family HTH domain